MSEKGYSFKCKIRTIKFFGLTTVLSFERIPVLDSSRKVLGVFCPGKRGICSCFHLPGLLLNQSERIHPGGLVNEIKNLNQA
jgi:hypothetical protein